MILDKQLMFSENQAVTASADAENVIDLGIGRDIGIGEELYVFTLLTEAMTDSGSDSTVAVNLTTDDNESLSSDTDTQTLYTFSATSAKGTFKYQRIQPLEYERYIGMEYAVANGNLTTGKFTSGITKDIQKWKAYASGFKV